MTRLPTRYAATGVALIAPLFAYGIIESYIILGLNPIYSIYYSVITMTTVGYGDHIVNNLHSHIISGSDNTALELLIKDLEKNLSDKEIAKIKKKN